MTDQHDTAADVAVIGGTFDPPHLGHIALVQAVQQARSPRRVLVVVAGHPPHRDEPSLDVDTRVELAHMAFGDLDGVEVSDIEVVGKPAYTVDTIELLRADGARRIDLVIGADQAIAFTEWRDWKRLATMVTLVVARRPEHVDDRVLDAVMSEMQREGVDLVTLDLRLPDISSTAVRHAVRHGTLDGIRDLLAPDVAARLDELSAGGWMADTMA